MSIPPPPDPSQGVFETLLVLDGEPVELDAHLRRLAHSLDVLYGATLAAGIEELAHEAAVGLHPGRLRLTVVPDGPGLRWDTKAEEIDPAIAFPGLDAGTALKSVQLPGGLGGHKWCDRSRLPHVGPGTAPLLIDVDGAVLEAGWANLFVARDGVLHTPPLDGRILPGVTRAAAIEAASGTGIDVAERRLTRGDLLAAEEVFLTSSLRRVEAARALDGVPIGGLGEVGARIGDALRHHLANLL